MIKNTLKRKIVILSLASLISSNLSTTAFSYTSDGQAISSNVPQMPILYSATSSTEKLNYSEEAVYNAIYRAMINLEDTAYLNNLSKIPNSNDTFRIMGKVLNDHPEIFYFSYSGTLYYTNGVLKLAYSDTKEKIKTQVAQITSKTNEILNSVIKEGMSPLQKELALHDYLVLNTSYDVTNYNNNTIPAESYNIYGTLLKNTAVCQGYSVTFKYLLNKVNIDSIVISSSSMNHAWNIVTIDGIKYHVDVTWDDPVPDQKNKTNYTYFNLSDTAIQKKSHKWTTTDYPACTNDKFSYFSNMTYVSNANGVFYYTDSSNSSLNKINLDGSGHTQLTKNHALYPVVYKNWVYYSNYSYAGYIFKIKTDGTGDQLVNKTYSTDLQISNGKLSYKNNSNDAIESITLTD
ncbi:DUF5050 domain-containing protein [Clostridium sp. SHJSY1]|uniref:DUF5050 domain-containing protein n=1 Tax=Clostridium sp. SHJSY1 TaxID=2942483 RepID=UPI0028753965|nr:DUF5050 domain-containing protein [Clostridium sp. SHJSY1]MDS0524248.1 DUF5050 domain-containing protein [Clostridium sp. SHJSY1]